MVGIFLEMQHAVRATVKNNLLWSNRRFLDSIPVVLLSEVCNYTSSMWRRNLGGFFFSFFLLGKKHHNCGSNGLNSHHLSFVFLFNLPSFTGVKTFLLVSMSNPGVLIPITKLQHQRALRGTEKVSEEEQEWSTRRTWRTVLNGYSQMMWENASQWSVHPSITTVEMNGSETALKDQSEGIVAFFEAALLSKRVSTRPVQLLLTSSPIEAMTKVDQCHGKF